MAEESEGPGTDMELGLGLEGRDALAGPVLIGLLDPSGPPVRRASVLALGGAQRLRLALEASLVLRRDASGPAGHNVSLEGSCR